MESYSRSALAVLVSQFFAGVREPAPLLAQIDALDDAQAAALFRALLREHQGRAGFADRSAHFDDLHQFDLRLNAVFCELLAGRTDMQSLLVPRESPLFHRDAATEAVETAVLRKDGYRVSSHRLDPAQQARILSEIAGCDFVNKGIFTRRASGARILAGIDNGSLTRSASRNGDTYWLEDHDQLAQKELFRQLALDPYILAMVARYLGCCPIHVQTNLWFSFPTYEDKWNHSGNAQMFHQDKEFTRFIKVFIYLSDVGEGNGPHCYVEGSHVDEVHRHGVALSERIADEEISRYYKSGRVRTLVGPAGTIAFGDTSCVHKGVPVQEGYRAMLQLEYASSLHLSPVCPFTSLSASRRAALPYPGAVVDRLLLNYDSPKRDDFRRIEAESVSPRPSLARRLVQLAKRYARSPPSPGA